MGIKPRGARLDNWGRSGVDVGRANAASVVPQATARVGPGAQVPLLPFSREETAEGVFRGMSRVLAVLGDNGSRHFVIQWRTDLESTEAALCRIPCKPIGYGKTFRSPRGALDVCRKFTPFLSLPNAQHSVLMPNRLSFPEACAEAVFRRPGVASTSRARFLRADTSLHSNRSSGTS